jgi:hypothetical protein
MECARPRYVAKRAEVADGGDLCAVSRHITGSSKKGDDLLP